MNRLQFAIAVLYIKVVLGQNAQLNIAKSFKAENMSRNADIFEPIRLLMKPTDAEVK